MNPTSDPETHFDREAVNRRYLEERDKRLVEGRSDIRDLRADTEFAEYRKDPFTPYIKRDPIAEDADVVIIGAGIGGLVAGAELRKAGLDKIRLIDEAGGVGGTWYWNRYPGIMCDVESYIYIPMLEELDYVPKTRYAYGSEIRTQLEALAQKFDLVDDALFHTLVSRAVWDDELARWLVTTDRGDTIRARYVVEAVGILNLMKLPDIPGMEDFKGKAFHTARWDYDYTGGSPDGKLDKLRDKIVGIMGTGATAVQVIPHLAESAKQVYVFQRTPSAIGYRGNRETPEGFAEELRQGPGWQRRRMYNFHDVLGGSDEPDMVHDAWTDYWPRARSIKRAPGQSIEDFMYQMEAADFGVMEEHRAWVDELVDDPEVAEGLKPYYRYLCKRPCFLDEYYPSFNSPNVTLVNCPAGIERITEKGLACNGREYELDLLIYATGFEAEVTPLPRRAAHDIVGRRGVSLAQAWSDGPETLHGMMTRGFPNMFFMPTPGQQSVISVNFTLVNSEGAEHIGQTIKLLEERGVRAFDVSKDAQDAYVESITSRFVPAFAVLEACTPSRINSEGHPEEAANPKTTSWGGGLGDLHGWIEMLKEWRESRDFTGLELEPAPPTEQSAS